MVYTIHNVHYCHNLHIFTRKSNTIEYFFSCIPEIFSVSYNFLFSSTPRNIRLHIIHLTLPSRGKKQIFIVQLYLTYIEKVKRIRNIPKCEVTCRRV